MNAHSYNTMQQRLGKYILEQQLGAGGTGVIYRSRHPLMNRSVAIKLLTATDPDQRQHLLDEAQVLARLSHPNIINIIDCDEQQGQLFLVMELLEESLDIQLAKGALPLDAALTLAIGILDGLAYAHAHGIIHRDIKPENILLRTDRTPVLADFGLARQMTTAASGVVMGTPAYIAPEQIRNDPTDARTDLYSFGAMLYQMVTGRLPFEGDDRDMILGHLRRTPIEPQQLMTAIPTGLNTLLMRLLAKEPAQRPQSAHEVRAALAQIAATPVVMASSIQPVQTVPAVSVRPTAPLNAEVGVTARINAPISARIGAVQPRPQSQVAPGRPIPMQNVGKWLLGLFVLLVIANIVNDQQWINRQQTVSSSIEVISTPGPTRLPTAVPTFTPMPYTPRMIGLPAGYVPLVAEQRQVAAMSQARPARNTSEFSYGSLGGSCSYLQMQLCGEIRNDAAQPRTNIEVVLEWNDSTGAPHRAIARPLIELLQPGQVTPFMTAFQTAQQLPDTSEIINVTVHSSVIVEPKRYIELNEQLLIKSAALSTGSDDTSPQQNIALDGDIQANTPWNHASPTGLLTLYNAQGQVVDSVRFSLSGAAFKQLSHGATAPLGMKATNHAGTTITTYHLAFATEIYR